MDRKMVEAEAKNRKKMMNRALSKFLSSPSRTEKFPPPLMRFLRSNAGSKSRGRSKSSPMFLMRKKSVAKTGAVEAIQEPSSPKVTCIGQVRVRRSSKSKKSNSFSQSTTKPLKRNSSSSSGTIKQTPCWWLRKAFCYHCFFPKFKKPRCYCPSFCKCILFSRSGCCKKVDSKDDNGDTSTRVESVGRGQHYGAATDDNGNSDYTGSSTNLEAQVHEESQQEFASCSSPPKNALLLTRCRSAPYRSSSLASRFWGSPLKGDEENENEVKSQVLQELQEHVSPPENGLKTAQNVMPEAYKSHTDEKEQTNSPPVCRNDDVAEPRFSSQSEEMGSSFDERSKVGKSIQDLRAIGGAAVHPLVLTRCKSEPARTGERLNPDDSQPCSQHKC